MRPIWPLCLPGRSFAAKKSSTRTSFTAKASSYFFAPIYYRVTRDYLEPAMKPYMWMVGVILAAAFAGCDSAGSGSSQGGAKITLLNASYDPTRELWKDLNGAFAPAYEKEHGG